MVPQFLGGEPVDTKGKDRRVVMAEWLTSPKIIFLNKHCKSCLGSLMGVGTVDPVDDIRVSIHLPTPNFSRARDQARIQLRFSSVGP